MATVKLYWEDPRCFDAESLVVSLDAHARTIVLHSTHFYPESGGQLGDHGLLRCGKGECAVVDTQIDDEGRILHYLDPELPAAALPDLGERVGYHIDSKRRIEHLTLHTGQHMLSRALLDVAGAKTVSSRLGESAATIDVDRKDLTPERLLEVEEHVNAVIDEDRGIRARFPTPDQLARMNLRRTPKVTENIRVIEVEGYDFTPCGGTHARHTSEVGQLRILETQSYKGGTRSTFASGPRARRVLHAESRTLRDLARRFTCGAADLPAAIDSIESKLKQSREALGAARAQLAEALGERLARARDQSDQSDTLPFEAHVPGLDRDALSQLATALATHTHVVALSTEVEGGRLLIVVRGPESEFDCGAWLKATLSERGGRGGGRAPRAEGRIPS